MDTSNEVLLVVQRIADGYVLCAQDISDEETTNAPGWFDASHIPDEYGYIIVRECAMHNMGRMTVIDQNSLLPKIVADCIGEYYEIAELRFLRLPEETITELPMMLQ